MPESLDELDRYIVYALQRDSRNTSARTIAEARGVSPSTVRKRITRLEEKDVITGYTLEVDYEAAGFQLYTLIICTAPIPQREELARQAREVDGVVSVREIMTGAENVHVTVVGEDGDDLSRIGRELNALGLEIIDEDLVRNEYNHPYHGFDSSAPSDDS